MERFAIESTAQTAATFEADLSGSYNSTHIGCGGSGFLSGNVDGELYYTETNSINIHIDGNCFYLGITQSTD